MFPDDTVMRVGSRWETQVEVRSGEKRRANEREAGVKFEFKSPAFTRTPGLLFQPRMSVLWYPW